jgi:hypothetical protein
MNADGPPGEIGRNSHSPCWIDKSSTLASGTCGSAVKLVKRKSLWGANFSLSKQVGISGGKKAAASSLRCRSFRVLRFAKAPLSATAYFVSILKQNLFRV